MAQVSLTTFISEQGAIWRARGARLAPGIIVAGLFAIAAYILQGLEIRLVGRAIFEALVLAILVGMLWRNVWGIGDRFIPGINFTAKEILEFAIVLLGASVDFRTIFKAGPALAVGIVLVVALAITMSTLIGRALGLNPKLAVLVAVGNSICGNSAIAAVAPVIDADADDIAASIALTAVLGVVVVLTLPLLIGVLHISLYQYGVLAGLSVYAVPQVLAATFSVSTLSGKVGTLVKLVRVLLLGPVVLAFSLRQGGAGASAFKLSKFVPWFIIGFALLAVGRSLGWLPTSIATPVQTLSGWLTVAAMAALGLGVHIRSVAKAGVRTSLAIILSLLVIIIASLTMIHTFHIGG